MTSSNGRWFPVAALAAWISIGGGAPGFAQPAPGPLAADGAAQSQSCLAAGAESFETLAEGAATAPVAELAAKAGVAANLAESCRQGLSPVQIADLAATTAKVRQFRTTRDRASLAFAAVEGYRLLATAQPRGDSDAPLPVALLDYSGFRYRAGLISSPPLWSEMRLALDFADGQWRAIAGDVADAALHSSFAGDLAAMRKALDRSNAAAARSAVAAQLDRVDALETYFAQHPPK